MPTFVITPWKRHAHLLQVRRELFQLGDSEEDERRHAVDWTATWKQRAALPHAIESTALLIDAQLHHDARVNSAFSIRATYSAAFSRFVTGFCDIQQTSVMKRSMFEKARSLDMPASFVELRHEATHEELPSLPRLVSSTKAALEWLWDYYWVNLDDDSLSSEESSPRTSPIPPTPPVTKEQLRAVLSNFSSKRRAEVKASKTDNSATSASGVACLELVKLCKGSRQALQLLCSLLLELKMLIPSGRVLHAPMTTAFAIWSNLIRRLIRHIPAFARLFIASMTETLTTATVLDVSADVYRQAVSQWLLHLFQGGVHWRQERIKEDIEDCRSLVVGECVASPNIWSVQVAKSLTHSEDANEEFKIRWEVLVDSLMLMDDDDEYDDIDANDEDKNGDDDDDDEVESLMCD